MVGLHAGWVVDRVHRRHLMIAVNLVRAAVLCAVTVGYLSGRLWLPLIVAAALLLGIAETLVDTALTAMMPTVVPPPDRTRANTRIEATINIAN